MWYAPAARICTFYWTSRKCLVEVLIETSKLRMSCFIFSESPIDYLQLQNQLCSKSSIERSTNSANMYNKKGNGYLHITEWIAASNERWRINDSKSNSSLLGYNDHIRQLLNLSYFSIRNRSCILRFNWFNFQVSKSHKVHKSLVRTFIWISTKWY